SCVGQVAVVRRVARGGSDEDGWIPRGSTVSRLAGLLFRQLEDRATAIRHGLWGCRVPLIDLQEVLQTTHGDGGPTIWSLKLPAFGQTGRRAASSGWKHLRAAAGGIARGAGGCTTRRARSGSPAADCCHRASPASRRFRQRGFSGITASGSEQCKDEEPGEAGVTHGFLKTGMRQ